MALAVLCGAGVGLGLLLIVMGLRDAVPRRRWPTERDAIPALVQRLGLRLGLAAAAGVLSGW